MIPDEQFMRRCFQLASLGKPNVSPNPMVGAVIVHNYQIIGEGYHEEYGQAHAEVNAINSIPAKFQHLLSKSTLYVSLEPCCHFGKTPPCCDLIIKNKIPRLVVSCLDPHSIVAGKGIKKIKAAGIEVRTKVLEEEGKYLLRTYLTHIFKQRPYIFLKYAKSADGFMGIKDHQIWISGKTSKFLTHRLRSEFDAILIGTNTALIDNPALTNRLWSGKSPIRIVIDRKLQLPVSLSVFDDKMTTICVHDTQITPITSSSHIRYVSVNFQQNFLKELLKKLDSLKIQSLMIEGGSKMLHSFIEAKLWDEAWVFNSPKHLFSPSKSNLLVKAPILPADMIVNKKTIGDDSLIYYKRKIL